MSFTLLATSLALVILCRALLRRQGHGAAPATNLEQGDLSLYPGECRVTRGGLELKLSPKEYKLLELFMQHPRRVFSREQLLEKVWDYDYFGDGRLVDVHVRRLRIKIELDPANPRHVVTVRGLGYRLQS